MKRSILILIVMLTACIGGVLGSIFTLKFFNLAGPAYPSIIDRQQSVLAAYAPDTSYKVPEGMDFLSTAKQVTSGVVHIRTSYGPGDFSVNPLEFYMDAPARSSGSGVIISDDGYIVTNFHVVENAAEMRVTLSNKRSFPAKLVGRDTENDLALLKIDARGLPFLLFGNSDELKPGQWVLATGYPLDLEATVTAGIMSTKRTNAGLLGLVPESEAAVQDEQE